MQALARTALKVAASAWDVVQRPQPGVVILLYHRVGARTTVDVDLPSAQFEEQIDSLARSGRVMRMHDALAVLSGAPSPVPDPVVITFDDGTEDVVEEALPILERHRVPALLYLATAFVQEQRPFPDDGRPVSWSALADAVSTGWLEVGSHTHTHALLDRLDVTSVEEELDRSIDLIGAHLGVAPEHFAYPKAVAPHPRAAEAVAARFRSAALAGTRANPIGATDMQRLARSPIQRSDGAWFAARKMAGGLALEDRLRVVRNRRRYVDAVT